MRIGRLQGSLSFIREPDPLSRLRPLGLITHPQRSAEVLAITEWLSRCLLSGSQVIVPAIVYYELKRELLRVKKTFSIGRLEAFINATPGRYVPLNR